MTVGHKDTVRRASLEKQKKALAHVFQGLFELLASAGDQ